MAKILIVDDNPVDRALIAAVVHKRGDEAKELTSADLVEDIARSAQPDVILMDVVMDGEDGFAVCRRLKKNPDTRNIPVVLVSARTSENDQFWGKRNGAVAYVCKPVSPENLNAAIDFALSSRVRSTKSPWRSWAIPSGLNYRGPGVRQPSVRPASAAAEQQERRPVKAAPADSKASADADGESAAGRAASEAMGAFRTAGRALRKTQD